MQLLRYRDETKYVDLNGLIQVSSLCMQASIHCMQASTRHDVRYVLITGCDIVK